MIQICHEQVVMHPSRGLTKQWRMDMLRRKYACELPSYYGLKLCVNPAPLALYSGRATC